MHAVTCLVPSDEMLPLFGRLRCERRENFDIIYLPYKNGAVQKRALRRLEKTEKGLLLCSGLHRAPLPKERFFGNLLFEDITGLIRKTIEHYGLSVPIGEMVLSMPPKDSARVINSAFHMARLFTVISPLPLPPLFADELYERTGVALRQSPSVPSRCKSAPLLIIGEDSAPLPFGFDMATIDLRKEPIRGKNVVSADTVRFAVPEEFLSLAEIWGGKIGADFAAFINEAAPHRAKIASVRGGADRVYLTV